MTRLWTQSDARAIAVQHDARGQLVAFTWQGRRQRIARVHQQWRVDSDWWSAEGEVSRAYLAVTTHEGLLCVLYHDQLDQRWYIAKVYD